MRKIFITRKALFLCLFLCCSLGLTRFNSFAETDSPRPPKLEISVPNNGAKVTNPLEFSGTAGPGMPVELHIDGIPRGKATADGQGKWRIKLEGQGTEGLEDNQSLEMGTQHKARLVGRGPGHEFKGTSEVVVFEIEK